MKRYISILAATLLGARAIFAQEPMIEPTPIIPKQSETKTEPEKPKNIQDLMSADEFKAAGLDKLSADELKSLNDWLQGYRQTAEKKASEETEKRAEQKTIDTFTGKKDQILSRVDGKFSGVTGNTVIKLENGTVWRQANREDHLRAQITDHPPVSVTHGMFGYKMRVVGTGEFYVNPVRNP